MTPEQLNAATGCGMMRAELWAPPITAAMAGYEINTKFRQSAFLAQVAHESGGFKYVREMWGPTAAQSKYEGRTDLGNTQPGDGYRYRGRGLIQITGRDNYAACGEALRLALTEVPELLEEPKHAADSAGWFWESHKLNELADQQLFSAITRRVNGGLNGQEERIALYHRALAVL
jgi:putative chitinase